MSQSNRYGITGYYGKWLYKGEHDEEEEVQPCIPEYPTKEAYGRYWLLMEQYRTAGENMKTLLESNDENQEEIYLAIERTKLLFEKSFQRNVNTNINEYIATKYDLLPMIIFSGEIRQANHYIKRYLDSGANVQIMIEFMHALQAHAQEFGNFQMLTDLMQAYNTFMFETDTDPTRRNRKVYSTRGSTQTTQTNRMTIIENIHKTEIHLYVTEDTIVYNGQNFIRQYLTAGVPLRVFKIPTVTNDKGEQVIPKIQTKLSAVRTHRKSRTNHSSNFVSFSDGQCPTTWKHIEDNKVKFLEVIE